MATSVQMLDATAVRDRRLPVRMWAMVDYGDARENAVVRDLSPTGFGIETARVLPLGAAIAITIGSAAPLGATIVHRDGGRTGCSLTTPLDEQAIDALTRDGPFASAPPSLLAAPEPEPARLPFAVRVAAITGGAALCWAALAGIAIAVAG